MQDPRRTTKGNFRHQLSDIIFLVISAVISGADDWENINLFGKSQIHWLKKFQPFKNGIPSADTLSRVFEALDYTNFSKAFMQWVDFVRNPDIVGEVIAIDGKSICGSADRTNEKSAIHMISAYATQNGLCLGQIASQSKRNEIKAIPQLLDMLDLKGNTVTIDAMGCQTAIVDKIREKKADYILAVKANQGELHQQVEKIISITQPESLHRWVDSDHGRVETRVCSVYNNLRFMDEKERWKDLKSILKIETQRYIKASGKTQTETRLYISNLKDCAETFNNKIRSHWGIENNLHWCLDMIFNEDNSRKRIGNSAKNFNIILKTALSLIVRESTEKISKKSKRLMAALSPEFREKILKV